MPENVYECLGLLWEAHESKLGCLSGVSNYIDAQNFTKYNEAGLGLLARGTEPQLKIYQKAILDQVETYLVPSYIPQGGYSLLSFDVGHVIAQSFEIEEIFS